MGDRVPTASTFDAPAVLEGDPAGPRDATAGELLVVGARIGRYVIEAHVGAGAMGRIYAAHDPELDRKVAIKLLRAERDDEVGRDRLLREARALARLAHPHVVAVFDVGAVGDRVFVAMEYVAGTTLTQVLARRRHAWREVLALLTPVAAGLAAVHATGQVHRDVKPDNIMLGDDGRVRLMDFGLACVPAPHDPDIALEATQPGRGHALDPAPLTQTGMWIGTPPYMAPERWRGDAADARSDQFAFCVTLWEALYGCRPFLGRGLAELERTITGGTVSPPPGTGDVPRWLQRVVARGLAVDPADRYPSMDALIEAVGRGRRWARARWIAATLGLAVAATAGIGFAATRARPPRQIPPLPAPLAHCEADEVCIKNWFPVPVCGRADGDAAGESRPCTPGSDDPCPGREVCVAVRDSGRCLPVCEVQDDRPACAPGCYNQQCAGKFDLCSREVGACRPVPCTTDADCVSVGACDFPLRGGAGFRCDASAGLCARAGSSDGRSAPAP